MITKYRQKMPPMSTSTINPLSIPQPLRRKGIENELLHLCETQDIVLLVVFGSFIRGEQTRTSDVDIAIEFDPHKPKSLFDLIHVEDELSRIFGRKADVGILSSLNPYIIDTIKEGMRVIYENR